MSTTSPNMGLTIPVVSQEPGPQYASEVNDSLTRIDGHTHATGYGVPITPNGLNITSDLPFGGNNVTLARSVRFSAQGTPIALPSDLGCVYVAGVDLYYNDVSGNQVRLTQSGGIAGSPGSITGLVSPATATYLNPTFVFQSDVSTAANLDARSIILRNSNPSSNGLTLNPPAAMGSNFNITLPTIPASQSILAIDNSGNISAPAVYPITSAGIAVNSISGSSIMATTIQRSNLVSVGQQLSPIIAFTTGTSSSILAGICSVTITTSGRPVMVIVTATQLNASNLTGTATSVNFIVQSDVGGTLLSSTLATRSGLDPTVPVPAGVDVSIPGSMSILDAPVAGTYRYSFKAQATSSLLGTGNKFGVFSARITAYEL